MRFLFIILLMITSFQIYAEPLLEIDVQPRKYDIESLALFKFDGRMINSGRINLVNYLNISHEFYKLLLNRFYSKSKIEIVDTEQSVQFIEGDRIKVLRSDDTKSYDEKMLQNSKVISKEPVKAINAFLYGRINRFYEGETFETSYIDITIYLVDSKSKVIYWVTSVRGCLKYVASAVIDSCLTGMYQEIDPKETEDIDWINPYEVRVKNWALQYRMGYFIGLGELGDTVDNGWAYSFSLNFKLPFWKMDQLINQIEFTIIPAFDTIDENIPYHAYQYNTFLPLVFNFIYNAYQFAPFNNAFPYLKAGLGISYNKMYYSGLSQYREGDTVLKPVFNLGLGLEYTQKIGQFYIFGKRFWISQLGFLVEVDYMKWFGTELSSSGLDLSFGLKYYF